MSPRTSQCHIASPGAARSHFATVRKDRRERELLIEAGKVILELSGQFNAHRTLMSRVRQQIERVEELREADVGLSKRFLRETPVVPVASSGNTTTVLKVYGPDEIEPDVILHAGREPEVPVFDHAGWHARIVGQPPLVGPNEPMTDIRQLSESPVMRLLYRASQYYLEEHPPKSAILFPAFVESVAAVVNMKRPTATHWVLIEVIAGMVASCPHDPHDNVDKCRSEYVRRRERWEKRLEHPKMTQRAIELKAAVSASGLGKTDLPVWSYFHMEPDDE